jgi:hypothetical protein|tara:strand:- start:1281 stop:1778 length:498 start_codon:yes stop_codon:yes gene_type:complete
MWTILKFNKKSLGLLKKDLQKMLGNEYILYLPKMQIQKYKNNKLTNSEVDLMGDYLFCYHKSFSNLNKLYNIKFLRGLKYFLEGHVKAQEEIENFISFCKKSENEKGYISKNFFKLNINSRYKFKSGPFSEKIFKIIDLQKNRINILMGNIKTQINYKDFLFSPI